MRRILSALLFLVALSCVNNFPDRGVVVPIEGHWEISVDSRAQYPDSTSWQITHCRLLFNDDSTFCCFDTTFFFNQNPEYNFAEVRRLAGVWEYGVTDSFVYREKNKNYRLHYQKVKLSYTVYSSRVGDIIARKNPGVVSEMVFTGYPAKKLEVLNFTSLKDSSGGSGTKIPEGIYYRTEITAECAKLNN